MKNILLYPTLLYLLLAIFPSFAQDCECNILEVESNSVAPCTLVVGDIDTVSTVAGLKDAINYANSEGGNRTILIEDGTYPISTPVWFPYITGSDIVFRSLSGNRNDVIIEGTGMASVSPDNEHGFYIVGNNYVTSADLTIRNVGNHGIATQGDNTFVHNVRIQDTFEQMIKGTSAGDGADNGIVQCSLFEYTAGIGPQYYIGGLDIHEGGNWTVNDNIFIDIASPSASEAEHAVHFWDFSENNTIERNLILNCDRGIGFGLGDSPNDGGIIRNNMIYNDGTHPFNDVGIGLETSPNTRVYNNTVYIAYPNAIEYRFAATNNVEITNNLTNQLITSRNDGEADLLTNYIEALAPWFIDVTNGDLHLSETNINVVDQGTNLAEITLDFDKTERPISGITDIGAHELPAPVSITTIEMPTIEIQVFPNPALNSFTIQSSTSAIYDLTIYNVLNQKIISYPNVDLTTSLTVNSDNWEPGIYFCQFSDKNKVLQTLKIILTD
jgi:hypothetical protein